MKRQATLPAIDSKRNQLNPIVSWIVTAVVLFIPGLSYGDSWVFPRDRDYQSANKEFIFHVKVRQFDKLNPQKCQGSLIGDRPTDAGRDSPPAF